MLEQGQRVGPYEIRAFVGQGGMGQVYEAYDPRLERKVALKVIQVPADAEPRRSDSGHLVTDFAARLLREARAVAALNHHNVVNIYDVGEDDGRLFLAMEFVVGHTLRALVGQPVPVERKVRWLVDVARALEAAHRAGIIHRDVKPENVIVREDGVVKVLDFGIARRTVAPTDDQKRVETITGGGGIAGTPVYMAPEQIRGHELDARADQFAWGVTAYELLCGARPWSDQGEVLAIVARILTDPHPPLEERAEGVPKIVAKTVSRALEKRPDDRFPSMADVADAIEPYAATTTHRDRVVVSPRREDPSAFAATTRVPTTLEVEEKETTTLESATRESRTPPRRPGIVRLAVPLALLGALAGGVYVVRARRVPRVVQTSRPVSEVPEAVTAFEDAQRLLHDGAEARGLAELDRALTLDPGLASAHLELAILTYSTDPTSARAHYQSAFQHRDRLSDRDFALLEAAEAFVSAHDMGEWETRLMRATLRFPNDTQLQYFLGDARVRQANDAGAKTAFEAAVKSDPAFVPALAELANVKKRMGDAQGALEVAEECLRRSPVASVCIAARTRVLSATGACSEAREAAARWVNLEPTSHEALGAHAAALFATGAPRPAIEEVLARRWGTFPEGKRRAEELFDRVWLAVADGKFDDAAARAEELAKALPPTADAFDHARPARLRVAVLTESGRHADAAAVARDYLDRLPAWASYDFAPDPSIAFYEPLYRAGRLSRPELDRAREAWLAAEDARVKGDARTRDKLAWLRWSHVWGGFAETRAEALEALERAPETSSELGRRGQAFDFDLGKVELLAGRVIDAVPHLKKAVSGCSSLTDSMVHTRARLYLGRALEAQGDRDAARREYERVVSLWGKATPTSITAREAAERLRRL